MQKSAKVRWGPYKIMIIALLPIIVFTWMTGWILVLIGRKMDLQETNKKNLETYYKLERHPITLQTSNKLWSNS